MGDLAWRVVHVWSRDRREYRYPMGSGQMVQTFFTLRVEVVRQTRL
jgi:hypothetical protein